LPLARVTVVGAGALGGYLGGRLLQAGVDVAFLVRPGRAAELRQHGLGIRSRHGDLHLPPHRLRFALEGPLEGVVLLAVKSYHLDEVLATAGPRLAPGSRVVPLQNGAEHVDRLSAALGPERVVPGVVYIEAGLVGGVVEQTSPFQRLVTGADPAVEPVLQALRSVGVDAVASPAIGEELVFKWMLISPFAAMTSLARADMAAAWADPDLAGLGEALVREVAEVAPAFGVTLAPVAVEQCLALLRTLGAGSTTSMARDLCAGRRLELDAIHRAVVRAGARLGLDTPAHRRVVAALAPFEFGREPGR
jgi:2-dehydropantoate 2-reductase